MIRGHLLSAICDKIGPYPDMVFKEKQDMRLVFVLLMGTYTKDPLPIHT